MKVYNADSIRNVVVLGHSGCGKTSIVEAALKVTEVVTRMGRVEEGNTVSDYDPEEIRRGVSISTSIIPIEWKENKINFMDTPGYFDFEGEVREALSVADLGLIVINARSGIEVGIEKAWNYCEERGIPKMIFVNQMDDEHANFEELSASLGEIFGKSIAPLQVPIREDGKFVGFVNALKKEGRKYVEGRTVPTDVPEEMEEVVNSIHEMIKEAVAETSEENLEKYFDGAEFTVEELQAGLRQGLTDGSLTPVICGSATLDIGIRVLLNSLVTFVPSSKKFLPEVTAKSAKTGEDVILKCENDEDFSAFVFKTIADPYVGRLSLFRVFSGIVKKDSIIYNSRTEETEKIARVYVMRGKEQIEVSEIRAGDIGAFAKMNDIITEDSLSTKENPVIFPPIDFPNSYLTFRIITKAKGEEEKLASALSKLLEEDRTLKFEISRETKESLVRGLGDNQIDVLLSNLKNKYKMNVELKEPSVPYREMIKSKIKVQGKYKKQSGGHGQYGDVYIEFEPSGDLTKNYIFEEKIFGGSVPRQYFPAVEKGIQECVDIGPLSGNPVVGIRCTLVDGSYHAVDSSEMAFKMATVMAFREAFTKASPIILEPIQTVEVVVPDDYMGDVMGDLTKKRGRILGMDKKGELQVIQAEVPLSEMFRYPTELRSMTQGRGRFDMEFSRYEEVPSEVQKKVIEEYKKSRE